MSSGMAEGSDLLISSDKDTGSTQRRRWSVMLDGSPEVLTELDSATAVAAVPASGAGWWDRRGGADASLWCDAVKSVDFLVIV